MIAERKTAQARASTSVPQPKPGGDRRSEQYQGNNITVMRGTKPDYLAARIARDCPDILDRMKAGEYPSVRAAAERA